MKVAFTPVRTRKRWSGRQVDPPRRVPVPVRRRSCW